MLEIGKTYRDVKEQNTQDVHILGVLPTDIKKPEYLNFSVYHVDRETKQSEPGELSIHEDVLNHYQEVKENSDV